uniref:MGS-like domain-containing protein n=1 Tax=Chenopodium quinoa TaxID=63459 RepID=A0A803M272_CHEQI
MPAFSVASACKAPSTLIFNRSRLLQSLSSQKLHTQSAAKVSAISTDIELLSLKSSSKKVKAMAVSESISTSQLESASTGSGTFTLPLFFYCANVIVLFYAFGYTIVSTGGTATSLEKAGVAVTKVEQLTCFPEMLDGRVKSLHPYIHGGILARRDLKHHMDALEEHGIGTFDVVVVNLYPFYDKVTSSGGVHFDEGIENIDIGGPAMIRAAAKFQSGYGSKLEEGVTFTNVLREHRDHAELLVLPVNCSSFINNDKFPPSFTVPLSLKSSLWYGENHQKAAFYVDKSLAEVNSGGIATAVQHHGKEMSYNNYLDADAAWNCVSEFNDPTCVVVKHTNPCGVASRSDIIEAYRLAVKADPVSAFGGIVAFNVEVDEALAKDIREFRSPTDGDTRMFYEIVVAPKYSEKRLEILRGKSKTLRIFEAKKNDKGKLSLRQVGGGWLAQESDDLTPEDIQFKVVSENTPTEKELSDAQFAWLCVKHNNCMLGMGSGQPNCLESMRIAKRKAGDEIKGASLASDAFFPFAWNDAVEEACQSGVSVIAEPVGSIRDKDAVDCCNKYGVSLVLTEVRHFHH